MRSTSIVSIQEPHDVLVDDWTLSPIASPLLILALPYLRSGRQMLQQWVSIIKIIIIIIIMATVRTHIYCFTNIPVYIYILVNENNDSFLINSPVARLLIESCSEDNPVTFAELIKSGGYDILISIKNQPCNYILKRARTVTIIINNNYI